MTETIKALREGNHLAFEKLFDNWYEPLCRYAFSILRNRDEAEEVVQKTFCKLWDQHETLDIKSSINSYLYRIVHNDSLNQIQQITSHKEHNLNFISTVNTEVNSTQETIESSELQKAIEIAMEKLPPQCKRVFELSRNEQLSYTEISKELNISTNTVENHISKALKLLRVELIEFLSIIIFLQIFN